MGKKLNLNGDVKMISKKTIAVLLIIGITFSLLTVGLAIIKPLLKEEAIYPDSASSSGRVSFYVGEKLEPQTVTGKVIFNVVEINKKGDKNE